MIGESEEIPARQDDQLAATGTAVAEQVEAVEELRSRPVLVTGAAGLVGTHVCRELAAHGWSVRAMIRDRGKAARRLDGISVQLAVGDLRDGVAVRRATEGVGTIIHLAAIAIERAGQSYEQVNADTTRALLDAARDAGAMRWVQMSQNGASSTSPHRFLRSKGVAEDAVRASGLQWTVLRPSVIFGPEDEFVNVLARLVRLTALIYPLPGGGTARFQPIAVNDIAAVCRIALEMPDTIGRSYGLGGPAVLTLREMVERVLIAMGVRRRLVPMPVAMLRPLVSLAQSALPHPPVTTSLLDLLDLDNTVSGNALRDVFHVSPTPFAPEELRYLKRITMGEAVKSLF